MIFNGDGKVVLALSKNFKLDIIKDGKTSKFELPDVSQATVTGTKVGTEFSLDISYDQEIASDGDAKLTKAQLKFDISHNVASGYWALKALSTTYKLKGATTDVTTQMDVTSNPGATGKQADQICGRGHLTCAPKNLCWACDNQIVKDNKKSPTIRLTMPGAKLQPVISNGTSDFRFGYEWDCDPLIPLSVWVGILLTLVLVTFLYWAIDMLTSLQTPNRFDDPRGKPLNVPSSE